MKVNKAIDILIEINSKLDDTTILTFKSWRVNLLHYLDFFFGKESAQYVFLDKNNYQLSNITYAGQENYVLEQNKKSLNLFINDCIKAIENTGIKKKEWKHYLVTKHPALFWSILVVVIGAFYAGGQCNGNKSINAANDDSQHKSEKAINHNDTIGLKK